MQCRDGSQLALRQSTDDGVGIGRAQILFYDVRKIAVNPLRCEICAPDSSASVPVFVGSALLSGQI